LWGERLAASRKGTRWDEVLFVLVAYRLIAPGSEWRLHREWFTRSALADLLGEDARLSESHKLYRCHDRLLVHKQAVFDHLVGRWRDLFNASFDVLLYDLTSTYFEADPPFVDGGKRRYGYSRDHRPDCVQVVIALVMTPEGLPLTYEVLAGNTSDKTTLKEFLARIERQYGKARRLLVIDVAADRAEFSYRLDRDKLRQVYRREGRYLLRTNLTEDDPAKLWNLYLQLVNVEEAFKNLKGDLAIRPIFHQLEQRIEAHIFIAFLAYCLYVTLARRLHALAPGLTPRSALEKFAAVQIIDVHVPTTDGRELLLTRYTEPEPELKLLLDKLKLKLPAQPPPRITASQASQATSL